MKKFKKIIYAAILLIVFSSCRFDKNHKNIDSFYTSRTFGQFPVLPLIKPIRLLQDDQTLKWNINMLDYSFKHLMDIQDLNTIGIDSVFIYGKTKQKEIKLYEYEKNDFVYAKKFSGISSSKKPLKLDGMIRLYPIDSISKTFVDPQRWFVINSLSNEIEAFFNEKKYKEYLKQKEVLIKMYDINRYDKQFKETGLLPWFPDSIKMKLKK